MAECPNVDIPSIMSSATSPILVERCEEKGCMRCRCPFSYSIAFMCTIVWKAVNIGTTIGQEKHIMIRAICNPKAWVIISPRVSCVTVETNCDLNGAVRFKLSSRYEGYFEEDFTSPSRTEVNNSISDVNIVINVGGKIVDIVWSDEEAL